MDHRKSYKIEQVSLTAGFIAALAGAVVNVALLVYAGFGVVIAGVLQAMVFCRCPECKENLSTRGGLPKFCPRCGSKLEE